MTASALKRLILVHSDKGGTGKSTVARLLAHYFMERAIPFAAVDSDKRNPKLHRHYHALIGIERIDCATPQGLGELFNRLGAHERVLVDTPAQFGDALDRLLGQMSIPNILDELDARITVVFVISRDKDCVQQLKAALAALEGEPIDWITIKNGYWGQAQEFVRYDNSQTRRQFLYQFAVRKVLI